MSALRIAAKPALAVLSLIYGALAALNRWLYVAGLRARRRLPGKTVSIGNLAAGGTGKSPVTMRLAEILLAEGAKPAILTRGYGVPLRRGDSLVLLAGTVIMPATTTTRVPDEARMQSALVPSVPVIAGPDRFAAAQRYLREAPAPTHWLLDDGFQHWALERDFDLVLLDAAKPLPALLPLGLARETPRALRRADVIIFTRCADGLPTPDARAAISRLLQRDVPILDSRMITELPPVSLGGAPFDRQQHLPTCLVSAVAQPEALRQAVTSELNCPVGAELRLGDHSPIDAARLEAACRGQHSIFTTAKDYWRDPTVFAGLPVPVFVLPLRLSWDEAALSRTISQLL